MTLLSDWGIARMMNEMASEVNRAFSANYIFFMRPEARCPMFATANPSCGGLALKSAFGAKRKKIPLFDAR
jgi:hypothetical protein